MKAVDEHESGEIKKLMSDQYMEPMLSDKVGFALKVSDMELFELYKNHFD